MTSSINPPPPSQSAVNEYRCPNDHGPGGHRCQLRIDHDLPHIASIDGVVTGWADDGAADAPLPPEPYPWAPSFPPAE